MYLSIFALDLYTLTIQHEGTSKAIVYVFWSHIIVNFRLQDTGAICIKESFLMLLLFSSYIVFGWVGLVFIQCTNNENIQLEKSLSILYVRLSIYLVLCHFFLLWIRTITNFFYQ